MTTFKIRSWFGRLGNNIVQLRNAILLGLYYNYNISFPMHHFFNKTFIQLNNDILNMNDYLVDNEGLEFFSKNSITKYSKEAFDQNHEKMQDILMNLFTIDYKSLTKLDENDVVIHIRSGDIFMSSLNDDYIVPPLSYYVEILESNKFNKIYLISEDDLNPCIPALIKLYPNIIHNKNSLEEDIKLVLRSQNIITSFGTFVPFLMYFTRYTKSYYQINWLVEPPKLPNLNVNIIDYTDFKNKIDKWRNTTEQYKLLLNYTKVIVD